MRLLGSDLVPRAGSLFRAMLRTNVFRVTAAVSFGLVLLCCIFLWQFWTNIVKDAQSRGSTFAYLLAEQTTRTFQAVDLTLAGLDAVFNAARLPPHAPAFEALLAQRVSELNFIRALYVVDRSGRLVQSSSGPKDVVPMRFAKHYFEAFLQDPKRNFLIGKPLFGLPGMLSAIPVFRRMSTPEGEFDGMVVASVDPNYFRDFYTAVDIGRSGSIDLYQDNGGILLASTGQDATGSMPPLVMPAPLFDADSQLGLLRSHSAASGAQIIAYHRAQGYPLVVAVGIDLKEIRSRWWRVAVPTLIALAVTVLMGIVIAVLVARRLEERRQAQTRAMVTQKLEALGQMTASVSHDFRNILAVVRATLQLVRKHGPTERIMSAAEEAIDRGSGLVTQLLAFSRRHTLRVEAADLNALLSGVAQVLGHAAGNNVTLEIDKAPSLPRCKVDQTQFDAAMMNLVVNARQAMPEGGTVSISTRRVSDRSGQGLGFVELKLSDTGCGIEPNDMKRIFEPFFTTKVDSGTGLGLSQVHGFMRQIGGDVSVSSVLGAGTTFSLLFPVVEDGSSGAAPPARNEPFITDAPSRLEEINAVPE